MRRLPQDLLVVSGGAGTLGRAFARVCEQRGIRTRLVSGVAWNSGDRAAAARTLDEIKPWAVVNAASYEDVDRAETDREGCHKANVVQAQTLAEICARLELPFLTFSSDLVFDGKKSAPYLESAPTGPLNFYGASLVEAERAVTRAHPGALVVRTGASFGPWDDGNFVASTVAAFCKNQSVRAPDDCTVSPTYLPDLVHACLDLLIDGEAGFWHLANAGAVSWAEWASRAAAAAGCDAASLEPCALATWGRPARRPVYSALGTERGMPLPSLENALARYFNDVRAA